MSALPMSDLITDWLQYTTEDGVITVSTDQKSATVSSTASGGRAYLRRFIPLVGGETVIFRFSARATTGLVQAALDYPASASFKSFVNVEGPDWKEYEIRIAIPLTHKTNQYVQLSCGSYFTETGDGEFANLRVEVEHQMRGPMATWASGVVGFTNDGIDPVSATLNENFVQSGIKNIEWDAGNPEELNITIAPCSALGNARMRPMIFTQFTTEYYPQLIAKAGDYDVNTGVIKVKFCNGTNAFVDIRTVVQSGESLFMSFMAVGI